MSCKKLEHNLWIRTQKGNKLIKLGHAIGLEIDPLNYICGLMLGYTIRIDGEPIGVYRTAKRCIEIINEIQQLLEKSYSELVIYQMPAKNN